MKILEKSKQAKLKVIHIFNALKSMPWLHILVLSICITISISVFLVLKTKSFRTIDTINTLTNLLTVNGVFSAILITYLFSRITWSKERKLEVYKDVIKLSQKITEYRRILNTLTNFFGFWVNDNATKLLIDNSKYITIDFYDYKLSLISNYKPKNYQLIEELRSHSDFQEGPSTLYLAMISLVRNRNNPNYIWQEELYKDFELNGIYNIKVVEKWLKCDLFGTIWYWFDQDYGFMNYSALRKDSRNYILSAVSRISKKYKGQELSNELLSDITDDFSSHYLKELYLKLVELKKGVTDLNLIIIILITISLILGVLTPLGLLLVQSKSYLFFFLVGIVASINAGIIAYFILRFPTLINRELKWI